MVHNLQTSPWFSIRPVRMLHHNPFSPSALMPREAEPQIQVVRGHEWGEHVLARLVHRRPVGVILRRVVWRAIAVGRENVGDG